AEVAEVKLFSIITHVNRMPVTDALQFGEIMEAFKASGEKSVTLQTLLMGETKLVELKKE
ncbi:MAG: hypothetical protein ACYTAF_07550, partial [Planctomycetota bacterium]